MFVFAVTQVTTLLAHDLSWAGLGRAMLALALLWWAWSAFVWAANAQDTDSPTLQLAMLVAMIFIFVAGLALPHAYARYGTLFALTYAGVRFIHLGVYADASRRGKASSAAIAGFAVTVTAGMALLVGGSFTGGWLRVALWVAAAAIDYAGPAWLTRERLRGLQQVAVAHFAERYGLFIIICLGESIVAVGVGASSRRIDVDLIAAVALGLLITVAMWWIYFDRFAEAAECRLREHHEPVLAAADAYSYIHLALVAGIIIFAVGIRYAIHAVDAPLGLGARLALCGGVALYLVGHAGFQARLVGAIGLEKLVAAAALLVLAGFAQGWPAWSVAAAASALIAVPCALETAAAGRRTAAQASRDCPDPPAPATPVPATTPPTRAPLEPSVGVDCQKP